MNQHLSRGGYSDQLVTDLAEDMADGITLLRLVQAMAMGESGESENLGGGGSVLQNSNPRPQYNALMSACCICRS